jgi:hypothetical protein
MPRHLAKDGAPAILHSAPEVFVTPCPAPRRIVRLASSACERNHPPGVLRSKSMMVDTAWQLC